MMFDWLDYRTWPRLALGVATALLISGCGAASVPPEPVSQNERSGLSEPWNSRGLPSEMITPVAKK